jgi:titin
VIGGERRAQRNVISGNWGVGIAIAFFGTSENHILGNYIGTDASGTAVLGNEQVGVLIDLWAMNNTIGPGNLISGNGDAGVMIQNYAAGNTVRGCLIGTDHTGAHPLPNGLAGITLLVGAADNLVGGDTSEARNVISGNGDIGVHLQDAETVRNKVIGNYVGTNAEGTLPLPNGRFGVAASLGAKDNLIGGTTANERNVLSGNGYSGVQLQDAGTTGNAVLGNYIGIDATGTAALGNETLGVAVFLGSTNNTVGGTMPGSRNVVSGNGKDGIGFWSASGNQIVGNLIGTDASGNTCVPNGGCGLYMVNASTRNMVGPENLIRCNNGGGVCIVGPDSLYNTVTRDTIHDNNGLPIDLIDFPQPVPPLAITGFLPGSNTVLGVTEPNYRVEIFANPSAAPAAWAYLGEATANAEGNFDLRLVDRPSYPFLAAVATDPQGTTWEFASGFQLAGGALAPAAMTTTVSSSTRIVYTHTLTNIGPDTDTFTVSVTSSQEWMETYEPSRVMLGGEMSATVSVTVCVPEGLAERTLDLSTVTVTSALNPDAPATAVDTTIYEWPSVYLPLVLRAP